jgi:hypothetical protein
MMLLNFKAYIKEDFLNEEYLAEDNAHNTTYGDAYETGTVLHIHDNSAAKHNKDKTYQSSISAIRKKHNAAIASLPSEKAHKALQSAHASGTAYISSLHKHEGIKPEHIQQVHHTNQGIDSHIGRTVDRPSNPHDLIIKGTKSKKSFMHGASLKATSGTASNNAAGSFERISASHGMDTKTSATWSRGKKNAGLTGKSGAEIKAVKKKPEIVAHNQATQRKSATAHAAAFLSLIHI